jgi:FkbM family methyltransferase
MVSAAQIRQNVIINGRPVLTATRAASWAAHCVARRRATIELWDDGPRMRLEPHLRAYGSTALYMKRLEYEPQLKVLADRVRPGDTVLDIGANFGVFSLTLASRCGSGRVHAFEPGQEALAQLRHNTAVLNPNLPITIHPVALSDSSRTAALHHSGGAPVTFSLSEDEAELGEESVQTVTLDQWRAEQGVDRVDVIKIDVEGHEPQALRGGLGLLADQRPDIMFEVSTSALARAGTTGQEPWDQLVDLGYEIFVLDRGDLRRLDSVEDGNLFAIHPGRPRP